MRRWQTLYEICHHNIIYRTLNFNIPLPPSRHRKRYPSHYREIWGFKNANIYCIQKAISNFATKSAISQPKRLWIFFLNFVLPKIIKFGYKTPHFMQKPITLSLKNDSHSPKVSKIIPQLIIRRYFSSNKVMKLHQKHTVKHQQIF